MMKMSSLSLVSMLLFAIALLSITSFSAAKETDHFHTFSRPVDNDLPPPPHLDAPTSPRAPLYRPSTASSKRSSSPQPAQAAPGEWLVMVDKSFRNDFLAVLEDMGHLHQRFGMRQWLDVPALREARRLHTERQQQRRSEGLEEERPWRVDVRDNEYGLQALEFDKRMMVKITIPDSLQAREEEVLESLRDMEWTEFIEPNMMVRVTSLSTQTLDSSASVYPWGLDRIDQRDLPLNQEYQYVSSTSNVLIYVVDTGILTTHQEFQGRASFGYNALGDGVDYDCNGHGTHVSGTAVGQTVGVAKSVSVVGVKVLNCSGDGSASDVISGITWATNNCPSGTNCLLSLSLGGDGTNAAMDAAIQAAYNAGLLAVSAAGNENVDACGVSPARSPFGIAVGAVDNTDTRAYFSNYGTCVSVFAPGVQIPSSYIGSDSTYALLSGTSQATPHVTGTAALYWGATNTGVGPSEVAGAMYASATINKLYNTATGSPNRMLYSLVDLGVVPTTAYAACQANPCTTSNGTISTSATTTTVSVPSGQITVSSTSARYGYLQAFLSASVDFDLTLQYNTGGAGSWTTVATSAGSSGNEWIQYATSANGAGYYRWQVVAAAGVAGAYSLSYQVPSSVQEGSDQSPSSGSALAPFWLPLF